MQFETKVRKFTHLPDVMTIVSAGFSSYLVLVITLHWICPFTIAKLIIVA